MNISKRSYVLNLSFWRGYAATCGDARKDLELITYFPLLIDRTNSIMVPKGQKSLNLEIFASIFDVLVY